RRYYCRAYNTDVRCRVYGKIGSGERGDLLCNGIIVVVHMAEYWDGPRAITGRRGHRGGCCTSDSIRERDNRVRRAMRDLECGDRGTLDAQLGRERVPADEVGLR